MIINDREIRRLAFEEEMIEPFSAHQVSKGMISYGLSSFGYDARMDYKMLILKTQYNNGYGNAIIIDPKNFDEKCFYEATAKQGKDAYIIIPPHSFALTKTLERFKIPRNVMAVCMGKSTYARCGIIINVTPLEPEWEGHVTIEISNTTPLPAKIYAGEGICQFIFFHNTYGCEVSYADRKGKYQNQTEITLPKVSK